MQLELYEMVDGGYLGLAAALTRAATVAAGYARSRRGSRWSGGPEADG